MDNTNTVQIILQGSINDQSICNIKKCHANMSSTILILNRIVNIFSCRFLSILTYTIFMQFHNLVGDSMINNSHEDHFS